MNRTTQTLLSLFLLISPTALLHAQSGSLDPSFNGNGYVIQPVNNLDVTQKILVQDDQKVLMVGMSFDASYVAQAYVFRYLPDGTPDLSFGTDGMFTHAQDFEADLYSAVIDADGRILLVGSTTDYQSYRLLLIRLLPDGTLDTAFGDGGVVVQNVGEVTSFGEDMGQDVVLDADGNILVSGSSYNADYVRRPVVVKFLPDGALDTSFGVEGVASIPVMEVGSSSFDGMAVQPDGKIVAAGYFGMTELWYVLLLARFNADGTLDTSFGDEGVVKYNHGNVDDEASDLKLGPDGSIVVAGMTVTQTYDYSALLAKFTPDGVLDTNFGTAGAVEENLANFDYACNLALMPDGKIVMAGTSGEGPPGSFDQAIWKYLPDGLRDASFGDNGLSHVVIPGHSTMIYGMAVQADGKVLIGGQARTPSVENHFYVARFSNDLTTGISTSAPVHPLVVFPDPATVGGTVWLEGDADLQPDARISLYGPDGRTVLSTTACLLRQDGKRVEITLPAVLAAGTYQLHIQQQGSRRSASLILLR